MSIFLSNVFFQFPPPQYPTDAPSTVPGSPRGFKRWLTKRKMNFKKATALLTLALTVPLSTGTIMLGHLVLKSMVDGSNSFAGPSYPGRRV